MARTSRRESHTRLYHVMGRGNNEENIFLKQNDKLQFLQYMELIQVKAPVELFAYCIMENHVHLMLRADLKDLSKYMHDLTGQYSLYFNGKNGRAGHVFQDRYKSECIEKEADFWNCLRYIHNNPVQAGKIKEFYRYPFSSAQEYLRKNSKLIHSIARKMIKSRFRTQKDFLDFHHISDETIFLDTAEDLQRRKYAVIKNLLERFLEEQQILLGELFLTPRLRKQFIEEMHEKLKLPYKQINDIMEMICLEIGFYRKNGG